MKYLLGVLGLALSVSSFGGGYGKPTEIEINALSNKNISVNHNDNKNAALSVSESRNRNTNTSGSIAGSRSDSSSRVSGVKSGSNSRSSVGNVESTGGQSISNISVRGDSNKYPSQSAASIYAVECSSGVSGQGRDGGFSVVSEELLLPATQNWLAQHGSDMSWSLQTACHVARVYVLTKYQQLKWYMTAQVLRLNPYLALHGHHMQNAADHSASRETSSTVGRGNDRSMVGFWFYCVDAVMSVIHIAKSSLRAHEGLRLKAYQCTADKTTIGYGRNLDDKGISNEEAELFP